MTRNLRTGAVALALLTIVLALTGVTLVTPTQPVAAIGTLSAVLGEQSDPNAHIKIPDAKLSLLDTKNAVVANTSSDLAGRFRLRAPQPGTYSLCWEVQGRQGCRREVVLQEPANYLGVVKVQFADRKLFGRVLTGDQRACWVLDPFFKLNVATTVEVLNSANVPAAPTVRANVDGDYLFLLKVSDTYQVTARCEKAQRKANAVLSTGAVRLDMTLPNRAPLIRELAARTAGNGVTSVTPNTPLELTARALDLDGDPVEYLWRDDDGVVPATTLPNQIARNAPAQAGLKTTYLMARDGRGGYAYRRFNLEVGAARIQVAGTVLDEVTRAPIVGASVEFGTARVTTNARGWFSISGKTNGEQRYVVNIRHPDYALWSQIVDRSNRGGVYELIRAQVTRQSIDSQMTVIDTRSSGWCGAGDRQTTPAGAVVTPIEYVDPERRANHQGLDAQYLRKLTTRVDCRQAGARIVLPAGSLEDANGVQVKGLVTAAIASLNPTRRSLPGDYRAIDASARQTELLSYGAVYAEFRDSSNRLLRLRAGAMAEVQVPVPAAQLATAKPSIDFWSYDEVTGKWSYESTAVLKNTATGPAYVAYTTHFSTLNMDVAEAGAATCVRFELDSDLLAWTDLRVRATISYNGNQVKTKETLLNGDQYHAIFRIPFGAAFPPNTLRLELFGTADGQSVALVDNVINTDARPQMTGADLWPDYPYAECGAPVVLAPPTGVVPEYSSNDATNRPYFLTGPYGTFLPDNAEDIATAYYDAIGATSDKPDLGTWWDLNGFDPLTGAGGTRAAYMNFNDLGFGRDMHCLETGSNLACYVTNYGAPNQAAANADAAVNQDDLQRGATVAMEFTSGAGAEAVQFYVYGNSGPAAGLLKFADLDGFGPKPVPQLCVVCHGGSPELTNDKVQHARFREFDLPSFRYANNQAWDFGQSVPAELDASAFGALNQMVRDATPATAPIHDLIQAWYPGSNFGIAPVQPAEPADWASHPDGYHNVYGTTCRTCHIARDDGAPTPPFIVFDAKTDFDGTSFRVCSKDFRNMPNAIITYKNFWLNTLRVNQYEGLMNPAIPLNTCKND
jgi:hypothetical protein